MSLQFEIGANFPHITILTWTISSPFKKSNTKYQNVELKEKAK